MRKIASYILAIVASFSGALPEARAQTTRDQIIDNYIEHRQKNPSLYQAPPITHIVPNFNTITYAGSFDYENIEILPADAEGNVLASYNSDISLQLKGYTIAPHLAMSLKRVGLGLSVETMHREAVYTASYAQGDGGKAGYVQTSSVDASGYGFNISFLPIPKFSKNIKVATILGTKSFNATHRSGSNVQSIVGGSTGSMQVRRYTVQKYELGLNVGVQLLRAFRLIPWADYRVTVLNADSGFSGNPQDFESELELFWKDQPAFRYGLNAALTLGGFELSIGGLLGTLGNLNSTPAFLKDNSLSLTLSFDQKGS